MRPTTRVKVIICTILFICSAMGGNARAGGEQWTVAHSITYARQLTTPRDSVSPGGRTAPTCPDPEPRDVRRCRALEQEILSSTVRLEIDAWIGQPAGPDGSSQRAYRPLRGNGHATVKDGRYLITHNHFSVPLSTHGEPAVIAFGKVSVFTASGQRLHLEGQSVILDHAGGRRETVVLNFGLVDGVGFFESAGLSSADFISGRPLTLEPGAEVAQINWDGAATYVQWTTVEAVTTQDGVPSLVLSKGLQPGASGGGVFWNGYHVANNWTAVETYDPNRQTYGEKSTAALNDDNVLSQSTPATGVTGLPGR